MSLAPGTRVGPYEVLSLLGAGGMGEVYRARDTKLNRDVALKLLPDLFARDADRLARLDREARTLAALNHPNIAHVHGLEESGTTRALVMELVEGEDLAHRLARRALPLEEALPIAEQIARALEAAHERDIVHRDLKPANVKITPDGAVKVLDFGLAKALKAPRSQLDSSETGTRSATIAAPALSTETGLIFGTASYMAPEQARGLPVDKRADIWSFGCVLYEMLTGTRLFAGNSTSDILAAVLRQEIDWTTLLSETPVAVRRLLTRCLVRDPRRRLRDIGDAVFELEAASAPVAGEGEALPAARPSRRSWFWPAVVLAAAVFGAAAGWFLRAPAHPPARATRFEVRLPAGHTLFVGLEAGLAVAPDGNGSRLAASRGTIQRSSSRASMNSNPM